MSETAELRRSNKALDKQFVMCYTPIMRIKHLPKTITKYNGKKEEVLELQKIYNIFRYSMKINNLLLKKI